MPIVILAKLVMINGKGAKRKCPKYTQSIVKVKLKNLKPEDSQTTNKFKNQNTSLVLKVLKKSLKLRQSKDSKTK